ncbi:COG3400 family protein [Campylobacter sp. RM16188]|uniref:COG3400 family protein n=1 Tax=Campylobacter sp. RM16188 TaxID=1705725 RepID=UPI001553BBD9|nr:TrkA C-terminal domain-containing protein [Campylobacter sp. RM16188]
MKNILIIADGIVAKHFLERLFVTKNSSHHYSIITYKEGIVPSGLKIENFSFYNFDPTSLDRLKRAADGYFSQFLIVLEDKFEALSVYRNLRQISKKTDMLIFDTWGLNDDNEISQDKHLTLLDGRNIMTIRLMDYLPDMPVIADNIGLGEGEIMEVKVPVGSSFMYRHIGSVQQKKWRIAMVYRGSNFMIARPNLMILPNDTLLIVGEPSVLLSVFKSIKREKGQFPSPFGLNLYTLLDMKHMSQDECMRLIDESIALNERLNNRRLYIKVINPTMNPVYERLKELEDSSIIISFDYFSCSASVIKSDILVFDIGLVITDNKFFKANKKLLFDIKKPVMKIGVGNLSQLKKGVILSGSEDMESHSSVILDCCSQLDVDITLYHFDTMNSNDDQSIVEHFENLSKIFGKKVEIINDKSENPLVKLSNEKNLLQFISFSRKMSRRDIFAIFSNDMNRLYGKLSDNIQIFIPIN